MQARLNGEGAQPPDAFALTYDPSRCGASCRSATNSVCRPETCRHIVDQLPVSLRLLNSPKVRCIVLRMKRDSEASECADYEVRS